MTTLRQVAEEISRYLVDQEEDYEFTHWTEVDILDYCRDAARIVAMNLKASFTTNKVMDLKPGSLQTLPAGCSEFVSVVGNVDKYGVLIDTVGRTSFRAQQTLHRPLCVRSDAGPGYRVSSWQFDVSNLSAFYLQPPVPAGIKARIMIACYGIPTIRSLDDELPIPDSLIPILKEFILYYAYGRDTESVPARQYADMHWKNGVTLLSGEKQAMAVQLSVASIPAARPA